MIEFSILADGKENYSFGELSNIVVLDGAANQLFQSKIIPNVIIGDMDAINDDALKFYTDHGVKVIQIDDQNTTDMDKGIMYCIEQKADLINIYNALGGRSDHTLYNLRILKKYHGRCALRIVHDNEIIEYYENVSVVVSAAVGEPIAIMSAPKAQLTTTGLKYDMNNFDLEFGGKESSSNAVAQDNVSINVKGGVFLIRPQNSSVKYL
jgi:thiamine pyrophosphokinase